MGPEAAAPPTAVAPSELNKILPPLAYFSVSFFTVIIFLLLYMNTTVFRQQQFRLNMSREYELSGVSQDAAPLVEYIRRLHLKSCAEAFPPHSPHSRHPPRPAPPQDPKQPTITESLVAKLLNYKKNGVFVEAGAYGLHGGGGSRTEWLEAALGWRGLLLTPDARDYFSLRARRTSPTTGAMHACLSTSTHLKEITYQESYMGEEVGVQALGGPSEDFSARVKCFPLYSTLLAARAQAADFLSIACGGCELPVMASLPHSKVHISVVEIVGKQTPELDALMKAKGYRLATKTPSSILYALHDLPTVKI